ncbi:MULTISPECIES: hypothetical protein [Sporosarcina]|uniref:hypothetical protein n=1 Tax=Sporosarcina TaxID=1569 RepID=UPI001E5721EB|nr:MULTISPECIES: hypothetical protein [Sporosarcina]GKV65022.1 hypothetical protein NCCP2331_11750 [Sporosarcina sp. NCCP-2331]GLB56657.1 hypothetical protein NCCP2378_24440 [Sporosarcina sp. NCCP-2378]
MKVYLRLFVGLIFILTLTGCFGEDYDVGVPRAYINLEVIEIQLTETNINWETQSENVHEAIEDVQEFGLTQNEIKVFANQEATLDFKENEKNGGDIWTDPNITAVLINDKKEIEIEMNDFREFRFPSDKGNFVLVVEFKSSAGSAQYVGNILIQ